MMADLRLEAIATIQMALDEAYRLRRDFPNDPVHERSIEVYTYIMQALELRPSRERWVSK